MDVVERKTVDREWAESHEVSEGGCGRGEG